MIDFLYEINKTCCLKNCSEQFVCCCLFPKKKVLPREVIWQFWMLKLNFIAHFSFKFDTHYVAINFETDSNFYELVYHHGLTWGGGGVQQQKRQRTSCDFPGGMIFFVLFCPLFEDILLTKSGKNNKKEHKRSKNTKIMIFFVLFWRHIFDQIRHKNVDFERVLKKNKKEQKRQRTS